MMEKVVDIDDVVSEVNAFGLYHYVQYTLALLPVLFAAMSNANFIFAAETVNYRCKVPICENTNSSVSTPAWWPQSVVDTQCTRPVFEADGINGSNGSCSNDNFIGHVEQCNTWIYDNNNSIVTEFELGCEEWKRTLVGTVHNIGVLVSMPLLGYVSDKWGRARASIVSSVGLAFGALKVLPRGSGLFGYNIYMALELLEAAFGAAIYTSSFVMVVELGGNDRRVMSTAMEGFIISFGELLLGIIAWKLPYWRHLLLVVYCPTILFLLYIFFMKESVRWLLLNGKAAAAKKTVALIAKMNKLTISEHVMTAIEEGTVVSEKGTSTPIEEFNIKLLLSSKTLLKRLLICSVWWFSSGYIYYGLLINSVVLPGNKYMNFCLTALVSIPGDLIAMMTLDRLGRKYILMLGYLFCGICCVVNGFIPQTSTVAVIVLFLLGKAAAALCYNVVYIYTSELFPTSARSSLVGVCSMASRVGTILAPLNPLLMAVWWSLPTLVFGVLALLSAAMMLLTPETKDMQLPDTVAQAENLRHVKK